MAKPKQKTYSSFLGTTLKFLILSLLFLFLIAISAKTIAQNQHDDEIRLIAHRGGVVDEKHAENSLAAINEAIRQGYWMIEVDVRETRDKRPVLQHEETFTRYYNDSRSASEMTWDEIKKLRSDIDGTHPLLFEELGNLVKGKIKLMLDIKGTDFSSQFYEEIEKVLEENDLLSSTFVLSGNQAKEFFSNRLLCSIGFDELMKKKDEGVPVKENYYFFTRANTISEEMIQKARELDIMIVVAVNEFRYIQAQKDVWESARKDVERLLSLGVRYFQIDSSYKPLFFQ